MTFGCLFGGQVEAQNGVGEVEKGKNCESKRDHDLEAFLEAKLSPKNRILKTFSCVSEHEEVYSVIRPEPNYTL